MKCNRSYKNTASWWKLNKYCNTNKFNIASYVDSKLLSKQLDCTQQSKSKCRRITQAAKMC